GSWMSSPSSNTVSSIDIATSRASLIAWIMPMMRCSVYAGAMVSVVVIGSLSSEVGVELGLIGLGAGVGEVEGVLDFGLDRGLGVGQLGVGRDPLVDQALTQARDRVVGLELGELLCGHVLHRVTGGVSAEPVGHGLDEGRPLALASGLDGGADRLVDLDRVVAVHMEGPHRIALRAITDLLGRGAEGVGGVLGVAVVLAQEDHRQVPHGGQVHGLV